MHLLRRIGDYPARNQEELLDLVLYQPRAFVEGKKPTPFSSYGLDLVIMEDWSFYQLLLGH